MEPGVQTVDLLAGGIVQVNPAALFQRFDLGQVIVYGQINSLQNKNLPFRCCGAAKLPGRENVRVQPPQLMR